MRNGINISGFSEIVHEVQNEPREANFHYEAKAKYTIGGGVLASVCPAKIGTLRAPRIFEIPILPKAATVQNSELPASTPSDLAVVAVSGCFLVSAATGFTSRRTTIEHLSMVTTAEFVGETECHPQFTYEIASRHSKDKAETEAVVQTVQEFSPNHRSFTTALPISLQIQFPDGTIKETHFKAHDGKADQANGATPPRSTNSVTCSWKYGTQLSAIRNQNEPQVDKAYPIDQPKQLAGLDWGPNPQEYLLAAISSDVLNGVLADRNIAGIELEELTVSARARVDIRGMLGVAEVPVHLQDIVLEVDVSALTTSDTQLVEASLKESIAASPICEIVRRAVPFLIS